MNPQKVNTPDHHALEPGDFMAQLAAHFEKYGRVAPVSKPVGPRLKAQTPHSIENKIRNMANPFKHG